jgi:hypothetical protein
VRCESCECCEDAEDETIALGDERDQAQDERDRVLAVCRRLVAAAREIAGPWRRATDAPEIDRLHKAIEDVEDEIASVV